MSKETTILDTIATYTKWRIKEQKKNIPLDLIRSEAESIQTPKFVFENALKKPGLSFICECKKASPSKGIMQRTSHILQSQKNMRRQVQTVYRYSQSLSGFLEVISI